MPQRAFRFRTRLRRIPRGAACLGAAVMLGLTASQSAGQITLEERGKAAGLVATNAADEVCICSQSWMTGGMAVGDFNNDGWQDIFWIGGGETADKLFINDGQGAFSDQASDWGLDELHAGCGASVGDYNNDGFLDIYVTSFGDPEVCDPELCAPAELDQVGVHRLYRNNGDGSFTNVAEEAGVSFSSQTIGTGYGSAFGDYDLDGDLDLFVSSWYQFADGNRLYRNNGDGTFTDVTGDALGDGIDFVWGFQPTFADMDGDLYPELLLAGDFETSRYFRNNGDGTFTNITVASGTGLDDNGMGQTVADFNNDGLLDWYVTSIHQDDPPPNISAGTGNMLYLNLGNHLFQEVSLESGVNDGGWGWGTVAVDLDQDGWMEIVEVNGRNSAEWILERAKLFYNMQDGTFEDIAESAGLDHDGQGRGVVAFDADNDGDQDLAISTNEGALAYYRNQTAGGSWLRVLLDTSGNPLLPPNGFGARVIATIGGVSRHRYLNSDPSYLGSSELAVHFGLGDATVIDELRVIWSRGYQTVLNNVAVNQHLTITAPSLADLSADGIVGPTDLALLLAAWGPVTNSGALVADLNNNGTVGPGDLATLLGSWGPT